MGILNKATSRIYPCSSLWYSPIIASIRIIQLYNIYKTICIDICKPCTHTLPCIGREIYIRQATCISVTTVTYCITIIETHLLYCASIFILIELDKVFQTITIDIYKLYTLVLFYAFRITKTMRIMHHYF